MKLLRDGESVCVGRPFGVLAGHRCDEVVFNFHDIRLMAEAAPEITRDWLIEVVMTRFGPGNVEHRMPHAADDCKWCHGSRTIPCPNCGEP
jgi:hypothetical protein